MVEMLLLCVFCLFCIAGICEFLYLIRLLFYFPKIRTKCYSFIVLKENYAVKQLNFIWQKIKWQGEDFAYVIIALTDNIKSEELLNCEKFITDKNIILCTSDSLSKYTYLQKLGVIKWKSTTQMNNEN